MSKIEVVIISFNKNTVLLMSSLILLAGAVLWKENDRNSGSVQTIIIENSPETTDFRTSEVIATTFKSVKTTAVSKKTISEISTYFTNIIEKSTEISEVFTETVDLYIDINNADAEELARLNGIGDYLAGQIIAYREENGGFDNIEEIVNVSGIGEKIFESIRDFIYVENPVYYSEEVPDESEQPAEVAEEEVPTEAETTESPLTLEDVVPINLNEADVEILMLLPGVDEETALNIIELRSEIANFSHVYELLHVKGITEEMLSEIIKYVYV